MEWLKINLPFLWCRSVISYKTDNKPLFSTDTVANAGMVVVVVEKLHSEPQPERYWTSVFFVQRAWASMMTLMLMCWGTTRSLLWSTSSTWPWRSPPPVSRVPGWLLWTMPARTPVRLWTSLLTHFTFLSFISWGLISILGNIYISLSFLPNELSEGMTSLGGGGGMDLKFVSAHLDTPDLIRTLTHANSVHGTDQMICWNSYLGPTTSY